MSLLRSPDRLSIFLGDSPALMGKLNHTKSRNGLDPKSLEIRQEMMLWSRFGNSLCWSDRPIIRPKESQPGPSKGGGLSVMERLYKRMEERGLDPKQLAQMSSNTKSTRPTETILHGKPLSSVGVRVISQPQGTQRSTSQQQKSRPPSTERSSSSMPPTIKLDVLKKYMST